MFFWNPPCFLYDPANVGNLISGSSAFSKPSLYTWKFLTQVLLKPSLKDFPPYWSEKWAQLFQEFIHSLVLPMLGTGVKIDIFQSCGHCWVFQTCWHIECSALTASSFRIWNSSVGIPSSPLALFVVILPWLYTPGCLALDEWPHHRGYLGH